LLRLDYPLAVEESWIYSSVRRYVEGAQYADYDGHLSLRRDVCDSGCRDRPVWNLYLALIRDLRWQQTMALDHPASLVFV
jgi:hypothetical protein